MMTRDAVLQGLLSLFTRPRYLEIGVSQGATFHALKAGRKVAVDPVFNFDLAEARRGNPNATYHEVTSDAYFGSIVDPAERFEVIYLDGLHTAEQTLRDLLNALDFLAPGGVILVDDVKPSTHLSAIPDRQRFALVREYLGSRSKTWMGDVYKLLFFIDSFLQQLTWRTVAENHGQAVIWRQRRQQVHERPLATVGAMSFEDFVAEASVLRAGPFGEIVAEFRAARRP